MTLTWKYSTTKARIKNTVRITARAPFVYSNWPRFFYGRFFHESGMLLLRNGLRFAIRRGSTDRATVSEVFVMRTYSNVPEGSVVVDCGANIGAFALNASLRAKHVYAIEPVSSNFDQLRKNIELNGKRNIFAERLAMSSDNGERRIFIAYGASSLHWGSGPSELVRSVTLQTFLDERQISSVDYLKMDCEGSEWEILLGATPKVLSRIRHIEMEYHYISGHKNVKPLLEHLASAGFEAKANDDGWNGGLVASSVLPSRDIPCS